MATDVLDDARATLDVLAHDLEYQHSDVLRSARRALAASRALIAEHERLDAAYTDVKSEYAEYRRDRQDQMTRLRAAIEDAERGSRTGNLLTPPWVVQSIADIRTEWQKVTRDGE